MSEFVSLCLQIKKEIYTQKCNIEHNFKYVFYQNGYHPILSNQTVTKTPHNIYLFIFLSLKKNNDIENNDILYLPESVQHVIILFYKALLRY